MASLRAAIPRAATRPRKRVRRLRASKRFGPSGRRRYGIQHAAQQPPGRAVEMRRMLVALAVSAGLLVCPASASGQLLDIGAGDLTAGVFPDGELAALQSSGYSFAVGGGMTSTGDKFAFSARLGPNGPS